MDIIKIKSQHEIPSGVWHKYYRGDLTDIVDIYKRRYGYEPDEVLITDDGLIAIPSHPGTGWVKEQK